MKLLRVNLEDLEFSGDGGHCAEVVQRMAVSAVLQEKEYYILDAIEATAKLDPELYKALTVPRARYFSIEDTCGHNCLVEFDSQDVIAHITATDVTEAELATLTKCGMTWVEADECEWFTAICGGLVIPKVARNATKAREQEEAEEARVRAQMLDDQREHDEELFNMMAAACALSGAQ